MIDKKSQAIETLLVNKDVYIVSIRALGVLLEELSDTFEKVRVAKYDKEYKKLILNILGTEITILSQISRGFESSLDTTIEPDPNKGFIN